MAETVSAKTRIKFQIDSTDTNGAATQNAQVLEDVSDTYANGTAAGQVDLGYSADGTLAASGTTDIDLDSGLTGLLGDSQTFVEVQALYIKNDGSGDLAVSGDFLGQSTDEIAVPAGGALYIDYGTAGEAVTASSKDVITLASAAGTTYRVGIVGRSA